MNAIKVVKFEERKTVAHRKCEFGKYTEA